MTRHEAERDEFAALANWLGARLQKATGDAAELKAALTEAIGNLDKAEKRMATLEIERDDARNALERERNRLAE